MAWLSLVVLSLLAADAERLQQHFRELRKEQANFYSPSQFVGLMGEDKIHQELKLSPEQIAKAKQAWRTLVQFDRANRGAMDEQQAMKIRDEGKQLSQDLERQLSETLTKEQKRRANQIMWQGGREFAIGSDRELIAELGLSDAQVARMDELRAKLESDSGALMAGESPPLDFGEKLRALRDACMNEIKATLTPEQAAKYQELLGAPFDQSGLGRQDE
jgi:hypothetical protein